ncbi:MAG: hypothetical protein GXP24_09775 [Planctomycetes bacterium]|nr:hypothetical protein [Planctomycetota bacterium]
MRSAIWFAAIFVMTAIVFHVLRKYRDREADNMVETSEMMTNFRDLHAEGGLSDEEFRTIKTKLADELRTELTTEPKTTLNDNSSTS